MSRCKKNSGANVVAATKKTRDVKVDDTMLTTEELPILNRVGKRFVGIRKISHMRLYGIHPSLNALGYYEYDLVPFDAEEFNRPFGCEYLVDELCDLVDHLFGDGHWLEVDSMHSSCSQGGFIRTRIDGNLVEFCDIRSIINRPYGGMSCYFLYNRELTDGQWVVAVTETKREEEAATKKMQVGMVDDTSRPLTTTDLNFVTLFINGFSEINVEFANDGEPIFAVGKVDQLCLDYAKGGTMNFMTLPSPDFEIAPSMTFMRATHIPKHVREWSPSQRVAEYLIRWFNEFYLPRIKRLPNIYRRLQSEAGTWEWLEKEAERVGLSAECWVRMHILGGRDRLLDGVAKHITEIKTTINDELFAG